MSRKQQTRNSTIRWRGECDCGRTVFARSRVEDSANNNEGIHAYCNKCESTVFCPEQVGTV